MSHFEVMAFRAPGEVQSLAIEAADAPEARRHVEAQGLTVVAVRSRQAMVAMRWRKVPFRLAMFNQELLSLVRAGLTVVDAVETLAEKEARPEARKVLESLLALLYEGNSLSRAMEAAPDAFPALYVATVRASERTGALAEALTRYIAYQNQSELVRKKVVSASIYPVLLVFAGTLVTAFLLTYVVPRFSRLYNDLGSDLPLLSRLLLKWGQMLQADAGLVLTAVVAFIAALAWGFTRPATRSWLMRQAWSVPAIGERLRIYQLARFYHTQGMLLRGGMAAPQALRMVSGLLQPGLRDNLSRAARAIAEGRSMSYAMETCGLATPVAVRMLRVGERTGQMGEMMERIAEFYDDEMARWVEWFTRLFEPLLMAFIGVVIGGIVVLMYLPIFELAGSLK